MLLPTKPLLFLLKKELKEEDLISEIPNGGKVRVIKEEGFVIYCNSLTGEDKYELIGNGNMLLEDLKYQYSDLTDIPIQHFIFYSPQGNPLDQEGFTLAECNILKGVTIRVAFAVKFKGA